MEKLEVCNADNAQEIGAIYAQSLKNRISLSDHQAQEYFIDSVQGSFREPLETEEEIRSLFENNELIPACLLYRDLDDLEAPIKGGEFLARRFVAGKGISTPGDWIQSMDKHGYRPKLNELDLDTAINVSSKLPNGFEVSSNLSDELLRDPGFADFVENKMKQYGVNHIDNACLEISEETKQFTVTMLLRLEFLIEKGFSLALDDAGTNNTEAVYKTLQEYEIPIKNVKIDGQVTPKILSEPEVIKKWVEAGENNPDTEDIVFEGGFPILLSPRILDALRELKSKMNGTLNWYVQGPIYTDDSYPYPPK